LAFAEGGHLERFAAQPGQPCEDTFLANFFARHGARLRHACSTIADHLALQSTIEGFDSHTNVHASVTWRDYAAADMAEPAWWRTAVTHLPAEWTQSVVALAGTCGWCLDEPATFTSAKTGMGLCKPCLTRLLSIAVAATG
jgi:hypothetical protein